MYNYGDHEINYQRRFPQWDGFFSFPYHKITLFEKKYDIKINNFNFQVKSVQSALSDLKRPPERLQSQRNCRLFIT